MTHTVVGLFDNRAKAQAAMQELVRLGFTRENIDVSNRRFGDQQTGAAHTTQVTVTEPTISDDIKNFFGSLFGGDKASAKNYTNAAVDADSIISIQVDSFEKARQVSAILDHFGAIDVDGHIAQNNQQAQGTPQNIVNLQHNANRQNASNLQNEMTVPVIEEQVQLDKQVVEREGARIKSRIIEKPVEANMRLREEHVVIDRRPVDRPVTQADLANFKEEEIVLTERAEVPIISKQARVVEEIIVGKNVTERNEVIHETVRRTDVEVENTDLDTDEDLTTRRAVG